MTRHFGGLVFPLRRVLSKEDNNHESDRFEGDDMAGRPSLLEIIANQHPGLTIGTYVEGDSMVVCLYCDGAETRIALTQQPSIADVDAILGIVANRLVCCRHCEDDSDPICRQDHRIMSNRLERFLHPDIYEEFLANAPLSVGARRSSGLPGLSPASR
jgi:hypothetical protein